MAGQTGDLVTKYKKLNSIEALDQAHPELSAKTAPVLARLDSCIAAQEELQDSLKTSAKSLRKSSSLSQSAKNELQKLIETSQSSIDEVQGSYEENLKDTLKDLAGSLKTTTDSLSDLQKSLGNSASDIAKLTGSAAADLASLQKSLSGSANLLNQASGQVSSISGRLKEMQQNHDFSQLEELVAENKDEISDFLAAPVSLKTHAVYKIENYGSSMAPFYSTLAIWIGGIILVAMMKVTVSETASRTDTCKITSIVPDGISLLYRWTAAAILIALWRSGSIWGSSANIRFAYAGVLVQQYRVRQYHLHLDRVSSVISARLSVWYLVMQVAEQRNVPDRGCTKVLPDRIRCRRLLIAWQYL